ncbi:MAG: type II CAAX prenyl endopeptidase Rce1 family protein [Candidatus Hermodarchaeota archaeon]
MERETQKSYYSIAKYTTYEILMDGQIASAGAHQARLIEKFKRNKNYIKNQFLALKIIFSLLLVFIPIIPLVTYLGFKSESSSYTINSISFLSSYLFVIYFGMTLLYTIMFGMVSTSSFMSGNSFKWLQTLPFSKKQIKKIGFMTLFRNIDVPLIILIAAFPIIMLIGTQNFLIFLASFLVSFLNTIFNFSLLIVIGEKLSFIFSESKGKSKRVNLLRTITMLGYFVMAFGSGMIFSVGFSAFDSFHTRFLINEPPTILNIILSLIPVFFATSYFITLSMAPTQFPIELLSSTLIGFTIFIFITWGVFKLAQRALRTTISTEIIIGETKKEDISVEITQQSTIMAYIRKDLVSATRDMQSFMFLFFPIFYPLILVFSMQGVIVTEVTSIEGVLILWSSIIGIYLIVPPMLIVGLLNLEESGSSIVASLPLLPRDQAKAKIILMFSIQGISLTFMTIILTLLTGSVLVFILFVVTLPIAWSLLLVMFELKIHFFGKIKYKYILEELHKENKIAKWIFMILIELALYLTLLFFGSLWIFTMGISRAMLTLLILGLIGLSLLIFTFTKMFPKERKIADYVTGGYIREHVNFGTISLIVLYFYFMYLVLPIESLIFVLTPNPPFFKFILFDFLIAFSLLFLLWLVIIPIGLKLPKRESYAQFSHTIGLSKFQPLWRNLTLGIGSLIILGLSTALFAGLLGRWVFDPDVVFSRPSVSTGLGWFIFIFMLRPGIWEEISFRGVILNLQLKKYSQLTSVLLNGILFGLFHYINLLGNPDLYTVSMQVIYASCLGIAFAYMYVKTKSLWPCMIAHYLIDSVGQIFLSGLFPNYTNLTLYFIFGIGVVPMILIIILTKLLSLNKRQEISIK